MQKTNHPDIYEHVKAHGGKKSQLSAFLEEVCSDIESKEGRGVPLVQKPAAKESTEKEEGGEAEDSQESSRAVRKEDDSEYYTNQHHRQPFLFTIVDIWMKLLVELLFSRL